MAVTFDLFFKTHNWSDYEDSEKYERDWVALIDTYRTKLASAIPSEHTCKLSGSIQELVESQFNALAYLYDAKLLSPSNFEITDTSLVELARDISAKKLTSVRVFEAFAKRAVLAHQFTNCFADLFLDEGLERAKFLDQYLSENGKPIGPLHGIPISVKEQINYRGKVTHAGYVSKLTNVTPQHGVTIQILENLGAVIYGRTNQPQTMMHLDSNNNITGLTRNPYNLSLSPGGSSSGEGALVSFGGSCVGVGTDIGGLIRAPAAFSGCHGFRPTSKRISTAGSVSACAGQESVLPVAGPLARLVQDIEFWMKAYINNGKPWELDGTLVMAPWREVSAPQLSSLTIGVVYDDGIVRITPPIRRGMDFAIEKLKAAGAKVVDFKALHTQLAMDTVNKMYACDGNYKQRELLAASGEPLTKLTRWSLNFGDSSRMYDATQNRELNVARDWLRTVYTQHLVNHKIDFVLSPVSHNVAPQPERAYNWSYTALWNLLDFPSLAFQTGLYQDPSIDVWGEVEYKCRNALEELESQEYDPKLYVGAPIALQLTGRRYYDEEVIAAAKSIVEQLNVDLFKH